GGTQTLARASYKSDTTSKIGFLLCSQLPSHFCVLEDCASIEFSALRQVSAVSRIPKQSGDVPAGRGPTTDDSDAEECPVTGLGGSPGCTDAEYSTLQKELEERNRQREDLIFKIKDLTDHNKKYKERLETQESSKRQQQHVLQRTHVTQLADRDRLISSLQDIIEEHERKILQLEQQIHGTSHAALGGTARLVADIQRLQDEKSQLASQFAEAQMQIEVCKADHGETIATLQKSLALAEKKALLCAGEQIDDNKENLGQISNTDAGSCSTDTEKQLERVQAENQRLAGEVSSLHRFYTRNSSIGFTPQTEEIRRLQDENDHLTSTLSTLQQKEVSWREQEASLRAEITSLRAEKQQTGRQLRDLQARWTSLQARDPDVVTHIDHVEVESEELRSRVTESQDQVTRLEQDVLHWETKCADRDRTVATLHKQLETLTTMLEESKEEKKLLQECLMEEVEKERESKELAVRDARNEVEKKLYELQVANQHMRLKLAHLHSSFEGVQQAYALLSRQARQFPNMVTMVVKGVRDEMLKAATDIAQENKDLIRKYHKEMHLRKKYHNELVELKGNIRVFCRVRPPIREDGTGPQAEVVMTFDPDDDGVVYVSNKGRIQTFEFDKVFTETSTQTEVFEEVRALVTCCIDGFNICIFAYGQTGSGKTFTMEGPSTDPGINQRALQELFQETAERGQDWHYTIEVSVLEIYNETIKDLLSSDNGNKLDVKMKADGGGYHVPGLHTVAVTSLKDVNQVFAVGKKNRATATTNMNEHSSRSHCLLCVTVTGVNRTTNTRTFGRLNLVDLAGSERVSKSGADGARLREAQNINKSLACLGDVIHALRIKQNHIPFRNSKLTYLLQDSLGGDSKTLMIVQVAPVEKNVAESTCSLSFGQRVRNVELGAATRKIENVDELKSPPSPISIGTPPAKKMALSSPVTVSQRFTPGKSSSPVTSSSKATPRSARQGLLWK
ncbi:hypothetical protein BaRGS_00030577, partial [Batillaria attramentaria]